MPAEGAKERPAFENLLEGRLRDPFHYLGPHPVLVDSVDHILVRTFQPRAAKVALVRGKKREPMKRVDERGLYEVVVPKQAKPLSYKFALIDRNDAETIVHDPYRFDPVLTDFDLHLFGEGTHRELYRKFGAHHTRQKNVAGVSFAVWAPNATGVSVVGSFNRWDGRTHPMRRRTHGVWELFLPAIEAGTLYKFRMQTHYRGMIADKADPFGRAMEVRPDTASIVTKKQGYAWKDRSWISARAKAQGLDRPMSVYEVHLGSWRRKGEEGTWLTYEEMANTLIPYVKKLGFTHLQLLPISEHPFDGSWGYQTVGYFAPTSRFGDPDDLRRFIDRAHAEGIGVLLDWVPAHFPKDGHGLGFFDGTHLYEHADPRKGYHPDWNTLIYNYGRREVAEFLIASALYWLDEFHIDGLRVDAVASMLYLDYSRGEGEWVPNEDGGRENREAVAFLREFNEVVHEAFPGTLTFAEESTAWPYVTKPVSEDGLGFDYKWNMGWMNDTLSYMKTDPLYRSHDARKITFSLVYAFSERYLLPLSHDEVVHGKCSLLMKMPGDSAQRHANLRLLYAHLFGHPGKKLMFMGGEIAQRREWDHDGALEWERLDDPESAGIHAYVRDLNRIYAKEEALHGNDFDPSGFAWIELESEDRTVFVYERIAKNGASRIIVALNFTPVPRPAFRIGVSEPGSYTLAISSDHKKYGGTHAGIFRTRESEEIAWHNRAHSIAVDLPPLTAIFMKRAPAKADS